MDAAQGRPAPDKAVEGKLARAGEDQGSERNGVEISALEGIAVGSSRSPANIVQLLYDSGGDRFALFVAPRAAAVNFGKYRLEGADLGALRCQRVECPRRDIYWFTTASRQYVFLRLHGSGDSGELFRRVVEGVR